jgi:uroporphyrinogen III methyltransferase/synthase
MEATTLKPLLGLKVLVTRPRDQARVLSEKLRALGALTFELPTIEIAPPQSYTQLDKAIHNLKSYDWIIFTSARGVQFFTDRLASLNVTLGKGDHIKVAAIGPATAAALKRVGLEPDFVPRQYLTEKTATGLGDVQGRRILLARADIASKRLPEILRERGALVDDIAAYRTVMPSCVTREKLQSILMKGIDLITFTSPSTVRNLAVLLSSEGLDGYLKGCKVACIGPVTHEAAKELGVHVDIVAKNHTIESLVEAIVNEIRTV